MRKEGRRCYVIDAPTRSFSWLPGTQEEVGTTANTAVRKGKGRHELWGTHSWAETMPINQRLVHLAMPSGTPLCAEGQSVAQRPRLARSLKLPQASWSVHHCHVRMTEWAEPDTAKKKRQFSPHFLEGRHACFEITAVNCFHRSNFKEANNHKVTTPPYQ